MNTVQSLEQERQAILDRMQMRRESYRRMLSEGEDFRAMPARSDGHAHSSAARRLDGAGASADTASYTYRRAPERFPRARLMKTVSEHPVLIALGVAAVFAIGPRRLARKVASSGAAIGAVATSRSRMDMLGRVLTLASAIAQSRRH